jgi:hypothetical protein
MCVCFSKDLIPEFLVSDAAFIFESETEPEAQVYSKK